MAPWSGSTVRRAGRLLVEWNGVRRPWWFEAVVVVGLYQFYSWLRIEVRGGVEQSLANARELIDVEKALGIWNEQSVQEAFLDWEWFIRFWNVFHGLAHFVFPPLVLIFLWFRHFDRYRFWRNVLGWVLVFGLVGFAVYPVTPPRLLPELGFVDTGVTVGGWGPIGESQPIDVGNAFAEIPSLHVGFSTWVFVALLAFVRSWWGRALLLAYPLAMTFSTIVTAKHYWLDAPAGVLVVLMGIAIEVTRRRLRAGPAGADQPDPPPPPAAGDAATRSTTTGQ